MDFDGWQEVEQTVGGPVNGAVFTQPGMETFDHVFSEGE